jgi:hypothetical protein
MEGRVPRPPKNWSDDDHSTDKGDKGNLNITDLNTSFGGTASSH